MNLLNWYSSHFLGAPAEETPRPPLYRWIFLGCLGLLLWGMVLAMTGCANEAEERAYFSKPNAEARAREKLVAYAKAQHVPLHEFKGPYFHETGGLDYPVYSVCYKHPVYFFCYDDYLNVLFSSPLGEMDQDFILYRWLKEQPDSSLDSEVKPDSTPKLKGEDP